MAPAKPAKVHLISLGCPKNTVDSEKMVGLLQGNDYEMTADPQQADVVVVNTCGFIGPAKEESLEAVMAAHRLKTTGRCRAVVVTGCLAQRYAEDLRRDLVEADQVLTLEEEPQIVRRIDSLLGRPRSGYRDRLPRRQLTPGHWAYLRIADGCDHQCAFCAIPAIRGRHRSEPLEELVAEAVRLAGHGVRELVLVSQDSVRYGVDLYGQPRLAELLRLLDQVEGLSWIRLMYTYPAFWSDELLEVFAHGTRICAYVDLPLQHIADPVLRRMRRAATRRQTEELLARLRQRLPGAGFRSTFIVGFPGETEAQYEELLDFVTTARFDHATGFAYSPEEGTAAHDLEGAVPEEVAQERLGRLLEAQEQVSTANNHALLGTRQTVLVDGPDELGRTCGRTERDAPEIDGQVVIEAGAVEPGRFVEVEVTGAAAHELTGRVVGRPY